MNGGLNQLDYREALSRQDRIRREADRLGPIMYELRMRKREQSAGKRIGEFAAAQVAKAQSSLSTLIRARVQADRQSAQ
jgi:hypothetical protein